MAVLGVGARATLLPAVLGEVLQPDEELLEFADLAGLLRRRFPLEVRQPVLDHVD